MAFPSVLLQAVAAFLIFAAGYLVLLLSVIICFTIATCLCKVGSLAWAYIVGSASLDDNAIPQIEGPGDSGPRLGSVQR